MPSSPLDVRDDGVGWRLPAGLAPGGVRLEVDWILGADPEFVRDGDCWAYDLPRPNADRLEYRLVLRDGDGRGDPRLDPANPRWIGNPFGDRSVIEFASYAEPRWIGTPADGTGVELDIAPRRLDTAVPARLWSPAGLDPARPAPLLVANDGTGLAQDAALLSWAAWHGARATPLRVLLLDPAPGRRDAWYAADDDYADEVAGEVLPAVDAQVAVSHRIGLGISLGAVATLHLQRRHPRAYDGVVLQSGSFFTRATDAQESGYSRFDRVCAAVERFTAEPPERTVPAFVCCGAIEENLANNEAMARVLDQQGYGVRWTVFRDAHTMTGWRDAWSPELDELVELLATDPR